MPSNRHGGLPLALWIALVTASAAAAGVLWLTDWTLGVPGEWSWARIAHPRGSRWDSLLGFIQAGLTLGGVGLVAWFGSRLMARASPPRGLASLTRAALLLGLVASGFLGTQLLQHSLPPGHGIGRSPWVLYYPGSSGYYYEARRVTSLEDFRQSYLAVLEDPDPRRRTLHLGTHPPGLFLGHLAVREACRRSAAVREAVLSWQPQRVRQAQATILEGGRPIPPIDTAALWLAALLTQLAAVATAIPIYLLVRVDHPPRTAWRAASLWLLVPAVSIFLPKSDCLYPLLATTSLWLWWSAIRYGGSWKAFLAAGISWIGLCLSLAFLPILALAAGLAAWMSWQGPFTRKQLATWSIASLAGLALPTLACWLTLELNLLSIWSSNLANHAAFYDQPEHPRSYLPWLGVNLIELAVALGIPLAGLAATGLVQRCRSGQTQARGPAWVCLGVWGLLWLSGKNMGEAARLWLLLMPLACWLAASTLDSIRNRDWALILALQAALGLAVIQRVSGFDFAGG
jgi:hypothetical protein